MGLMKNRRVISLVINGLIVLLECFVMTNTFYGYLLAPTFQGGSNVLMFRFFTEDSNILLGLSSLAYLLAVVFRKGQPIPNWIKKIRFIATNAVMTTFVVVFLFLAPYAGVVYHAYYVMFSWPNMCFTHFLCPFLSVFSFVYCEEKEAGITPWKEAFYGLVSVVLYAIIVGSLASTQSISSDPSVNNVYGFMDATANAWWVTPLAFTLIISATYGEGVGLLAWQKKRPE
jgi:hypothetical protein